MSAALKALTLPLANGSRTDVLGVGIEAIPAYNSYHIKGTGNGYVVTMGGRRLYISGDTGNIPDMRALTDIDVAFVCMNLPWTMSVNDATAAVRAFQPRVVYPYHFKGSVFWKLGQPGFSSGRRLAPTSASKCVRKWY